MLLIADTFHDSLSRLDAKWQPHVKSAVYDFQIDPSRPSLSLERLHTREKNFWSVRASGELRVIVYRDGERSILCYVDHHDAAYQWAERHRMGVHPTTGAAQLVKLETRTEVVVKRVEGEPAVFARYEDGYLLGLGVPSEWLPAVRAVGMSSFERLLEQLPAEAAERLLDLALGNPVPLPTVTLAPDPFLHPDARRRFHVVDNQDELRRALDAPWEKWIVFLHPTQRAIVERELKGPAKVSGSAGTGKTVVALHRAATLLRRNPTARVLLTSFSKTLAVRLGQHAALLLGEDAPERRRLDIVHLHKLAQNLWSKETGRHFKALTSRQLVGFIKDAVKATPGSEFSVAFLRSEWAAVIEPNGIDSWEAYRSVSRAGRGTSLGARQRRAVWEVVSQVQAAVRREGLMSWDRLCLETAALVSRRLELAYDHVVADECQDLGSAELKLLRALARSGGNDLFLCGDAGQRIFCQRIPWSTVGIDVRGRSVRLTVNYRTTDQIRTFADRLLPASLEGEDGEAEGRGTISLLHGPPPEVSGFSSVEEEIEKVAEWLKTRLGEGYRPGDVAMFARTEGLLGTRARRVLERLGIEGHALEDDSAPVVDRPALGTMHRAKGLEFKVVVILGAEEGQLPLPTALEGTADAAEREAVEEQERNLLYVACTRARERVLITHVGRVSPSLVGREGGYRTISHK
jgi:hypothetical protein